MFVVVYLWLQILFIYQFRIICNVLKQVIFKDCTDNQDMDLKMEDIKSGCKKGNKKEEDLSKTREKKEHNTSLLRSTRNRKVPVHYLD
jgi:hypothetical protein